MSKPREHVSPEDLKAVAEKAGEYVKGAKDEADHIAREMGAGTL